MFQCNVQNSKNRTTSREIKYFFVQILPCFMSQNSGLQYNDKLSCYSTSHDGNFSSNKSFRLHVSFYKLFRLFLPSFKLINYPLMYLFRYIMLYMYFIQSLDVLKSFVFFGSFFGNFDLTPFWILKYLFLVYHYLN